MRVLLVHNYYGSSAPSGENQVFGDEKAMLERHGVSVDVFTRHSDEIRLVVGGWWLVNGLRKVWGLVKGAACTVANPFAARALKKKIREFKPDVVHFHNTFPLISPLAVRAAKKSGAKVVMTLHNYRMVCAAGIPMRGGKVCRECFAVAEQSNNRTIRTILPAARHRCYRGSLLATVPLALNIWLYRNRWAKWVDQFIVLSEFQKQIMIECGLPADKIVVKGNFVQSIIPKNSTNQTMRSGVVFVGRLSDEKGVKTLLKAWRIFEQSKQSSTSNNLSSVALAKEDRTILTLIGDGDQRAEYELLARGLNVKFLGKLSHGEVMRKLAKAKCIVQPSACWETFGLAIVEAASVGTPAVASDVGAFPDVIRTLGVGEVFKAGDAQALLGAIVRMLMRSDYDVLCQRCLKETTEKYSEDSNYKRLIQIYQGGYVECRRFITR